MKLKKITYILVFFLTTLSYGFHKEHREYSTYGNIKVLGRSAFANYNEFNKFKIIGKLSQQLCQKLNYKDTIVLEFEHIYSNYKPNLIIIEKGNTDYISKLYRIEKIDSIYSAPNNNKNIGICIRQIAQKFDVVEVLKLLEYVIINHENLIFEKHKVKLRNFELKRTKIINYHSINKKLIKSIINNPKTSELVKKIISSDVLFFEFENIKGKWNNEEFIIYNEFSSIKYKDIFCITELKDGILIFETNKNFIYFTNTDKQFQKFHIKTKLNYSYYYSHFIFQENSKRVNDGELFIYQPFNTENGFIFSEIENKIVKKYKS
ncbi:MAG: hypothetical protein ACOVNP_09370 [Flavobacterium sp.]